MECFKIENLSFTYPNREKKALKNISLTIKQGEFVVLCGKTGCGKTTLLRLLKPALSPFGDINGKIFFEGRKLSELSQREQTTDIGFVMQRVENQIVTDKVWHELAFGLESLGLPTKEIRARVGEMASFFGIHNWFHKKTSELSGGQKQLLNLASIMVMNPKVIILDEPVSQLDPIASSEFLKTLEKINKELGVTIILSEHRLEDAIPLCDRVLVLEKGEIFAEASPCEIGEKLKDKEMFKALPTPVRIHSRVKNNLKCPINVKEGRKWLNELSLPLKEFPIKEEKYRENTILEGKNIYFRYEKNSPDVVRNFTVKINRGEIFAILGGNGSGKTTVLSLLCGLYKPYRGKVLCNKKIICLPQNPYTLLIEKSVALELLDMTDNKEKIKKISKLCNIDALLNYHPYDLSGGEAQRVALAKVLLADPEILLMDEPTKGMDAPFKEKFGGILKTLKEEGITVVMVSHDIEFCGENADRCSLFFDGNIVSTGTPREFFDGKSFYTTSANKMSRGIIKNALLEEDVVCALGGEV